MFDATPLLSLYAGRRLRHLASQMAPQSQEQTLLRLVHRAAQTRFGRDHDFATIRSVADFQQRVPLRRYEDFWRTYWRPSFPHLVDCTWPGSIPYFALTSGTTSGKTKYIPVSLPMMRTNEAAGLDLFAHHLANRPRSRLMGGRSFMLGGSTDLMELAPGIKGGDLSGIAGSRIPWWVRRRYFPPPDLAAITDWETKIERLAPASLMANIRLLGGTPSWLLLFFDKLQELRPTAARRLVTYYPNLELLVHGGVNFAPYQRQFERLLAGGHAELREVYAASEGFVAVADRLPGQGLRMIVDNGLFFEFVPVAELELPTPTRHWLANAELHVNYALVLSNCAGLWSYVLGDTVMLVDRQPPRLLLTGRTSYVLSAFGEHLIAHEIERAVAIGAQAIELSVTDYSVAPVIPEQAGGRGVHLFVVEFAERHPGPEEIATFAQALDRSLAEANDDYRVHRSGGYGMALPQVRAVAPGTFAGWMKMRGQLGSQHKVPRIINDPALFQSLLEFVSR